MSQQQLAESLGITFQQVQKYEKGANRISASKLFDIAEALHTPVGWFFDGLSAEHAEAETTDALTEFAATAGGLEVAEMWPVIPPKTRTSVVGLLKAIKENEVATAARRTG